MQPKYFKEKDLPWKDLETIGLAAGRQLLLNGEDLVALLSGRRTGLLELRNLDAGDIRIRSMEAKLSLNRESSGEATLLIHPAYRRPKRPDFLEPEQAELLVSGKVASVVSKKAGTGGEDRELLVEYDPETREFIASDTSRIIAPHTVNDQELTPAQRDAYRKGKEVQLSDQTAFAFTAVDRQGVRANRLHLIASVLIDGGLSYLVFKGLNHLFNGAEGKQAQAPDKNVQQDAGRSTDQLPLAPERGQNGAGLSR